MQTATEAATEAAPAAGVAGPNPEAATVYQNSYQWRLPVVPPPPRSKPGRAQSEYQREFKWHPSPSGTPTPSTPTPQTPEPIRPQSSAEVNGAGDTIKLAAALVKTQAAEEPAPQSPATKPVDIRHNGQFVREPEQLSVVGEPIAAAGMPTKTDGRGLSLRHELVRQQTLQSSSVDEKTKKIVALEANRLSKKSRSYSMYSLSDQLKTAEAAEELVNTQESEYKREFVNWAEYGEFTREQISSEKSAKSTTALRRRGSWSGSLPTPLKWLGGFESPEISKLQPATRDPKSSRAPPKRPKTSAEFRNYHDADYDDFAFESLPRTDKASGRTGLMDGKLDGSSYRNSSDDIHSAADYSKTRRDPYNNERRRDRDYDDHLSEAASGRRDRHDERYRDRDYDDRRRDYNYYDKNAHDERRDRYDDHGRERDHDLRNEYNSRRGDRSDRGDNGDHYDRYDRYRDRDYDDRYNEATYSDRRGDRYDEHSRDRDYEDRRSESRYGERVRDRDYDDRRTESRLGDRRPDDRLGDADRRSESRYGDRRSDRQERLHERDYSDYRHGERRGDAAYEERQNTSRYSSRSSSQAPDESRYSERNGHSRNTSYSSQNSQLLRGSDELSQPSSPAHPPSLIENFRTRTRSSLSSNSSVSTPSSPPTPNGYDADPRWRKPQGAYKEQLYSGVYSKEAPMYEKERWHGYPSKDQTPLRKGYYYGDEDEDEALEMPSRSRRGLGSGSHRSTRSPSPANDYRKYSRRDVISPNYSPNYSSRPPSRATSVSSHSTSIEEESALLSDMLREADTATLKSLTDQLSIFRVSRENGVNTGFNASIPTASTKKGSNTTAKTGVKAGARSTTTKTGARTTSTTRAGAKTTPTKTGANTTTATRAGARTASTASRTSSAASTRKAPMSPKSAVPATAARRGHRPASSAASSISSTPSLRSLNNLGMNERIPATSFSEARQALGRARAKVEEMLELVSNGSYDF